MKGFLSFLNFKFLPTSPDFGLLILRAGLGGGMLYLHGWEKAKKYFGWYEWAPKHLVDDRKAIINGFYDPLHLGFKWSFFAVGLVEVVCSALLIIGFCSRFAAAGLAVVTGVAFFGYHHHFLKGDGNDGERAMAYFVAFVALVFAGPGKFAFDGNGGGGGGH